MTMYKFAARWSTEDMEKTGNALANLFSAMSNSEIVSLGGGSPAKEALPVEALREISQDVFRRDGKGIEALAYGTTQGIQELREIIVEQLLAPKGVTTSAKNVMITAGGLETMNLICQAFINPGDIILVESPTFVHCVMIFQMFQAKCIPCKMDDKGLVIDDVEEKIKKYNPKFIYTIPTFQNPTGVTLAQDRRQKLAELAEKYDTIVLEDDPYRDIRYSGADLYPIKHFDKTGHVVLANSFSKIFSPGSRLGYAVASDEIMSKMLDAKMATNSHCSKISEVLCAEFFKRGYFPAHLRKICDIYRLRRDAMVESLDKYFPAEAKHTNPDGGLFVWVELPQKINTTKLLEGAVKNCGIAFVAGEGFFAEGNGKGSNCMRLSFGNTAPDVIRDAIKRLGEYINEHLY